MRNCSRVLRHMFCMLTGFAPALTCSPLGYLSCNISHTFLRVRCRPQRTRCQRHEYWSWWPLPCLTDRYCCSLPLERMVNWITSAPVLPKSDWRYSGTLKGKAKIWHVFAQHSSANQGRLGSLRSFPKYDIAITTACASSSSLCVPHHRHRVHLFVVAVCATFAS